jgi:hypothetical protein
LLSLAGELERYAELSMNIKLRLEGASHDSIESLVAHLSDDAVASPWRSTVPLVEYWRHPSSLAALWRSLDVSPPASVELAFEHPTPVGGGSGKPSFTDLMIVADELAVAIEAKFTEPRYETVGAWLGPKPSENRLAVLAGWLRYIREATGCELSADAVRELPYQVIHRTASVCALQRPRRAVIYQVFADPLPGYYERDLRSLFAILNPTNSVSGWVHACTYSPSAAYQSLLERWHRGKRGMSTEVRALLASGGSMAVSSTSLLCVSA